MMLSVIFKCKSSVNESLFGGGTCASLNRRFCLKWLICFAFQLHNNEHKCSWLYLSVDMCNMIGQFRELHGLLKSKVCLIWFLPLYLNPENKYCTNLVFLVTTVSQRTLFFTPHIYSLHVLLLGHAYQLKKTRSITLCADLCFWIKPALVTQKNNWEMP